MAALVGLGFARDGALKNAIPHAPSIGGSQRVTTLAQAEAYAT
jgi:hypothetical protein